MILCGVMLCRKGRSHSPLLPHHFHGGFWLECKEDQTETHDTIWDHVELSSTQLNNLLWVKGRSSKGPREVSGLVSSVISSLGAGEEG